MSNRTILWDILLEQGTISSSQLEHIVRLQQETGGIFADIIIREGILEEQELLFLLSRALGIAAIPEERLRHLALSPEIHRRIPRAIAFAKVLVPFDLDTNEGILSVAMLDPSDSTVLEQLYQTCRVAEIRTYLARRSTILDSISIAYSGDNDELEMERLANIPFLGPVSSALKLSSRRSSSRLFPSAYEPKVEIDPELEEEIAALSTQAEQARSVKSKRTILSKETTKKSELQAATFNRPDSSDTSLTPVTTFAPPLRQGRSLLRGERDVELQTTTFRPSDIGEHTDKINFNILGLEPATTINRAMLDDTPPLLLDPPTIPANTIAKQDHELDTLLKELLSSVGILVAMLEERIDLSGGSYRDYGRISRLVARELGFDELTVGRVALAAHLFSLDIALRRELGVPPVLDVIAVFSPQPSGPGGLSPSLRLLGAKALNLGEENEEPPGVSLIRLVVDYLSLCDESESEILDMETIAQLLRTSGGNPLHIDALIRAIEFDESIGNETIVTISNPVKP